MNTHESFPSEEDPVEEILKEFGNIRLRNPHYGLPEHENDPEIMSLFEAKESCPPLIDALVRADSPDLRQQIIAIYIVE